MRYYTAKLFKQLKSGFKRTINWNKGHSKVTIQVQNRYLDYMFDPSFQGLYRFFIFSFDHYVNRKWYTKYYLLRLEIKDYHFVIDGQSLFDQSLKNNLRTYVNIWKFPTGQGDNCTTGC